MSEPDTETVDTDDESGAVSRRTYLGLVTTASAGTASYSGTVAASTTSADSPSVSTQGYGLGGYGEGGYGGDAQRTGVCSYTDKNNNINIGGLLDAIDDWRSNKIGIPILLDVIDGWRKQGPVSGC